MTHTYSKAVSEYDPDHERALAEAITKAIVEASLLSDANAIVIRTGEVAGALITALACTLAMSPSVTRTPQAIRKTADDLAKKLRRQISSAERCEDLKDFMRRTFNGNGPEGNA